MIVLEIVLILAAVFIAVRLGDSEGGPWLDEGERHRRRTPSQRRPARAHESGELSDSPSPSVHLYDQEAERVYAALRDRVDEVVHP